MSSSCSLCHRAKYKGPPLDDCLVPGSEECLRTGLEKAGKNLDAAWETEEKLRAQVAKLEERQQRHLELIKNLSQTVPLDEEVANALRQRGVLLSEIGALRAKVTILQLATPMLPELVVPPPPESPGGKHHCNQSDAGDCDVGEPYAEQSCDCCCHRCGPYNTYLIALRARGRVVRVNSAREALLEAQKELDER